MSNTARPPRPHPVPSFLASPPTGWAFALLLALLLGGCASAGVGVWPEGSGESAARALVERSVAAHGGNLFEEIDDLTVSYEGRWGRLTPRIQPVLADKGFRRQSVETYLLENEVVRQVHEGPQGKKTVVRDRDSIDVDYHGARITNDEHQVTSALVADVYIMLTTGPSFFLRQGVELELGPPERHKGRTLDVALARLRPGFGLSEEDRVKLWIDRETSLLERVQFTLEGYERTRGAEVDVRFEEHRTLEGRVWPTLFVERIRRPLDLFAHRWRLTGLELDRGLTDEELREGGSARVAERPRALDPTRTSALNDDELSAP